MTIKIENDETTISLLRPVDTPQQPHQWKQSKPCEENSFLLHQGRSAVFIDPHCDSGSYLYSGSVLTADDILIGSLPVVNKDSNNAYTYEEESIDSFIEDDSSSVSSFSSNSEERQGKSVRFSDPLVSHVFTRPRTRPEDVRALFYSYEETQRFRQEYRFEKKMLARMDADPALVSATEPLKDNDIGVQPKKENSKGRHQISRVVVLHNDTMETFYQSETQLSTLKDYSSYCLKGLSQSSKSDDFFDNDSFWSGSITWY